MATNLAIDEKLLDEALRVGGHPTKKATVTEALLENIQRRKQGQIVGLSAQFCPNVTRQRGWPCRGEGEPSSRGAARPRSMCRSLSR